MLYNAKLANDMARDMLDEGIYVVGFFFPVVPNGAARIRVQLSAAQAGLRPRELDRSARRDLLATLRRRELAVAGIDDGLDVEIEVIAEA